MNNYYIHVTGLNEETTTDTIHYYFDNKKRSGVGDVYYVDRLNKKECDIFFMSDKAIQDITDKPFCIDKAKLTVVEEGSSFSDRLLVQNIHKVTTKDGLKCYVKAQTGKAVQNIVTDSSGSGKAILEFENTIDFTAVELACQDNTLDSNALKLKPIRSSKKIVVSGYDNGSKDDLLFYFDNPRRSGGEDVEDVKTNHDGTHLVEFLTSQCIISVCKRQHSLKGKHLKVQIDYHCMDTYDSPDMSIEEGEAGIANGHDHTYCKRLIVEKPRNRITPDLQQIPNSLSFPYTHISRNCVWNVDGGITQMDRKKFEDYIDIYKTCLSSENSVKKDPSSVCTEHAEDGTTKLYQRNTDVKEHKQIHQEENGAQVPIFPRTKERRTSTRAQVPIFPGTKEKRTSTSVVTLMSKAKRNFIVFYYLCHTLATVSVQRYFSRKIPESILATHLKSHQNDLKESHWKCTNDQLAVLFPASLSSVRSKSFDFDLLYKLIRNTCTFLESPTRGWGVQPLPEDITEEDDIERIRYNRQLLRNNTELRLNDSDFKQLWTDLSLALIRLNETILSDITNLENPKLDRHVNKRILEQSKREIENRKTGIETKFRYISEKEDDFTILKDTNMIKQKEDAHYTTYIKHEIASRVCSLFLPILKENRTFNVASGASTREIRDCTFTPGDGWIVTDFKNSELIMNDDCIHSKLSKPMFVTCIDGDVAVSSSNERKVTLFDIRTGKIKREIHTKETVLGITNTSTHLLVRAGNTGCRFISSDPSDRLIPISGNNMPYIATWEENIFLTNWKSHQINSYNIFGDIQWSFYNENIRSPNGVTTDKEGNVFIVGTYSHNILILSKNYKETKRYRFEDAGMKYPIAIDYDQISGRLMVCNMKGTVKIFDVVATDMR